MRFKVFYNMLVSELSAGHFIFLVGHCSLLLNDSYFGICLNLLRVIKVICIL